jgi:hypothetical protein
MYSSPVAVNGPVPQKFPPLDGVTLIGGSGLTVTAISPELIEVLEKLHVEVST